MLKAALILVLLAPLLVAFGPRKSKPEYIKDDPKPQVMVRTLLSQDIFETKVFGGFIESEQNRPAASEVTGTVDKFLVRPGDRVKRGQILFLVKPRGLANEFQHHKVASPLTGLVSSQLKEIGDFVQPGDAVVQIANPDKLTIRFDAALQDVIHLSNGMLAEVKIAEPGLPESTVTGEITAVSPASHPDLRTYQVYMSINCSKDCPKPFRLGAFARVIVKENPRTGFLVEREFLHDRNTAVYVVDKSSKLKKLAVSTGKTDGKFVEVTGGLEDGMKLVTSHSGKLREDREVIVRELEEERNRLLEKSPALNEH